jgi:GNAT superfamily N-acetyltransferase
MFQPTDELNWARILTSAQEFNSIKVAHNHFVKEFGKWHDELSKRCLFIQNKENIPVGTAMAWFNNSFQGRVYGRLHWVAICREYQGLGLGKPLVNLAMQKLAQYHDKAYLTTQTTSYKAINIYLDFGFKPFITADTQKRGWVLLSILLNHPQLSI